MEYHERRGVLELFRRKATITGNAAIYFNGLDVILSLEFRPVGQESTVVEGNIGPGVKIDNLSNTTGEPIVVKNNWFINGSAHISHSGYGPLRPLKTLNNHFLNISFLGINLTNSPSAEVLLENNIFAYSVPGTGFQFEPRPDFAE